MNQTVSQECVILPGIRDGVELYYEGKGNYSLKEVGDLKVDILVERDDDFKMKDFDILSLEEIDILTAIKGGRIKAKTLYGDYYLPITSGTEHNSIIKIPNLGVPMNYASTISYSKDLRRSEKRGD